MAKCKEHANTVTTFMLCYPAHPEIADWPHVEPALTGSAQTHGGVLGSSERMGQLLMTSLTRSFAFPFSGSFYFTLPTGQILLRDVQVTRLDESIRYVCSIWVVLCSKMSVKTRFCELEKVQKTHTAKLSLSRWRWCLTKTRLIDSNGWAQLTTFGVYFVDSDFCSG